MTMNATNIFPVIMIRLDVGAVSGSNTKTVDFKIFETDGMLQASQ